MNHGDLVKNILKNSDKDKAFEAIERYFSFIGPCNYFPICSDGCPNQHKNNCFYIGVDEHVIALAAHSLMTKIYLKIQVDKTGLKIYSVKCS